MLNEIENIISGSEGGKLSAKIAESGGEVRIVPHGNKDFEELMRMLERNGFALMSLFCVQTSAKEFQLIYAFEKTGHPEIAVVHRRAGESASSVASLFPSACWYEREITDGFGMAFEGAFDGRRLFLHETYPDGFHPLLKSFENRRIECSRPTAEEYAFKKMEGEGVYHIPVGPVHAGIIEPGHFRFSVIGETIFNMEIRMFYKHRGIEKLAEGKTPEECIGIAESISGDESVANAVAFCMAAEKIGGIVIPERARRIRTILMELERIYSHLGDIAGMIIDVAYPAGASPFFVMREEALRLNAELTGSRFMKNYVCIGGVRKDVSTDSAAKISRWLKEFSARFDSAVKEILSFSMVVDRFEGTGIIRAGLIAPLHLTGPAARASSGEMDTRRDRPYAAYGSIPIRRMSMKEGDVMARFKMKAAEIGESARIIKACIGGMPEGPVRADAANARDGSAFSVVEAPRGQNVHWLCVKGGVMERYKARTASFCNWQSIEHAVIGNIVPDFPLINKSLNLSYAGTDL
ncbi:MAG: NADH-quinone oxidoreductase subunit C [Candidatus Aenigmarchaeota archaeon]|nr:NADH-quinone oxidoreductase subunit C [Candidatus Aenigmarchaeota archaeon]